MRWVEEERTMVAGALETPERGQPRAVVAFLRLYAPFNDWREAQPLFVRRPKSADWTSLGRERLPR
jgi:hypothetical protein